MDGNPEALALIGLGESPHFRSDQFCDFLCKSIGNFKEFLPRRLSYPKVGRQNTHQSTGERFEGYRLDRPNALPEDSFSLFCPLKDRVVGYIIHDHALSTR